jgi:hypothetical protein
VRGLRWPGEEPGDDVERLLGAGAALEAETEVVHADDTGLRRRHALAVDRLVADDDAVLVGADLGAPDPERLRQQHGMGLGHLRDLDMGEL